ncbi:uncharacterized protein SPAPADRAFT_59946 [Spathaspora passalidarum NRRL Y-27907]|uniref:F-actin-capping protein subunit alpha n=1 Tax=Spathaspora passalidarum (strain NRRL Y-27907 / 11-Y1) TaxID=619300 RepID=G3AIZ9_SPAPN|nr:uncharacterized protein SPAPADRAFT_59946 [Spathaspora passalidarum NRRL Y-27907]EGW34512.1 hypothetical protein SPAPADRAFT_59946 [Spathaspora passalidarum NRRL Y-27907]
MSVKLNQLVDSLVKTSPPGELPQINNSLSALTHESIDQALEKYINENSSVFSGYIASQYNKDANSSKYIDYVSKKMFNIDTKSFKAIDIESYTAHADYPSYFDELVKKLETYGEDHYPQFAFTVIPGDVVRVIIIGRRLNPDNFYTGQWKSEYAIQNGQISGTVNLDIHYYEDGNVRLKLDEKLDGESVGGSASDIVNFISNSETKVTLKIIDQFNDLNQQQFKNLRRLLPITRSKINWGNAIGNYRLGSDVVNKK